MRILVTGATGFLGSHLVDRLLEQGEEVHVLVRKTSNLRWLLGKSLHLHYGDVVGDLKGLQQAVVGMDVVYHLAGIIKSVRRLDYYEVNTQGTANLLEACLAINPGVKRVVVVTSIAAHGPSLPESPFTEEDFCQPITDYGRSKRDAELITFRFLDRLPITIVRPPAIYGPRDEQVLSFFKMVKKGLVVIPGWQKRILSMAYVQDIVSGILLAGNLPQAIGEIFNLGDGEAYSWQEIAQFVGKAFHQKAHSLLAPSPVVYMVAGISEIIGTLTRRVYALNWDYAKNLLQKSWAVDISKAKKVLGYEPKFSLASGAQETADWYELEGWL